nr:PAS domain-containing protein [Deltaproteobacteria bacterium]
MIAAALSAMPWMAHAQPMEIPAAISEGSVPAAPGTGVQAMFVLGFFRGSPYTLSHARDILAGTSLTPAFESWCGLLPQVDFTNGTTVDSLGRSAPTTMCLPFQDPLSEQSQPCRPLPGLPSGRYSTNGGAVLRLRGWFAVRSAGTYTFAWGHDDGMAFDVGPVPVFAYHDGTAPRVDRRVLRFEAPGLYPFQLDWFDSIGGALIDWYVAEGEHPEGQLAADGFRLFPTSDLYPSGALPCTRDCERCALPTPRCDFAASRCVACLDDRDCARGTRCERGECAVPTLPDAGSPSDAGLDAGADASLDAGLAPLSPEGGCGCAVGNTGPARGAPLAAMLALALCRGLRRRERTIAAMNAVDARAMSIPRELDKDFLAEVIDHIAHPIFVKDREFRFVLLNRAMEGMLGISRAEMLGHTDYDFFPKEQADWFREKDVEMFTLGQRVEITEEPITDKGGHQHTLATSKVPLRDASGVITHLVGIIHDITPLKRAEEALREVTSALELRMQERTNDLLEAQTELVRRERLAVIGLFAGTLAHQIRN